MATATCTHEHTHQIGDDHCYTGSVAVEPYTDENRAAHGGITYDIECNACGARRSVNRNQSHVEVSPWRPSREVRRQQAARLRASVPAAPAAVIMTCSDGRKVRASVDREGMIALEGSAYSTADERAIIAALPPSWIEAAKITRRALLAAASAEAEV